MAVRIDIISIGTLARNLLWNESAPRRTGHATTVLISAGKRNIVVNPGLPAPALQARFNERLGGKIESVTDVFLTHLANDTLSGIELFEHAKWWCSETERDDFEKRIDRERADAKTLRELYKRLQPAPDKLVAGVDLFPLPGFTAGTCGLLVSAPLTTTLIAGPAVASLDHFLAGQVLPEVQELEKAKASLAEVYEIADIVVPGYDNYFANPRAIGA